MKQVKTKHVKAGHVEQNELYLYFINDGKSYNSISKILNKMNREASLLVRKNGNVKQFNYSKYTNDLIPFVQKAANKYLADLDSAMRFSVPDIRAVAKDLARYYGVEAFFNAQSEENASVSTVGPVSVSSGGFKTEIDVLRRFMGNIRTLRHPVLHNTLVIYASRVGTLTRPLLFRIESELKKYMPDYKMTNIWKNDPIYTANPDKRPDYTGCQFMWRQDKMPTRVIHIDIPSMSIVLKFE